MTEYKSQLSNSEIDEVLKCIIDKGFIVRMDNILVAKRQGNNIILKNALFSARVKITKVGNESNIELKTNYNLLIYISLIFIVAFFMMFLFAEKVKINGNPNPSFFERVIFVSVGALLFSIFVPIFIRLKLDFIKRIEKEFKLTNYN